MPSAVEIEAALRERLQATHVVRARPDAAPPPPLRSAQHPATLTRLVPQSVADVGDGCGSKFEVEVESPQFEGKALLARHRLVRASAGRAFAHRTAALTAALRSTPRAVSGKRSA